MAVIENFDAISVQEQMKFAEALLNTINSESIFSDQTNFEITEVEASSLTGGLYIGVKQTNPIEVERKATWTAANEDDAESDPDDADYYNDIDEDALMEAALESGASDFVAEEGFCEIKTEPSELYAVAEALKAAGYVIASSEVEKVPSTYVTLSDADDIKKMNLLIEHLEDDDDVAEVYHNWENCDE